MAVTPPVGSPRGFGLIEFMLVISLAALIATMTLPLSSKWSNAAALQQAASLVQHLYTRTKSLALSNPDDARAGAQSAMLCASNGTLYVQRGATLRCGVDPVWSTQLGPGITLALDPTSSNSQPPFACAALDALGLPVQVSLNSQTCSTAMRLHVHKGDLSRAVVLY
jgi:prepilin-type N-terminal cleavage/methylation domain-containing protein